MALLYDAFCLYCNATTVWVHPDLEPGKPDRCTKCGKHIHEQAAARRAARPAWSKWTLDEICRAWVLRVVNRAPSLSEAARRLGLHRRSLQRKLEKWDARPTLHNGKRRRPGR